MKKAITLFAAALAAASVLTGCGKGSQPTPAQTPTTVSAPAPESDIVNIGDKPLDEISKLLDDDRSPIRAYSKENIPELVATVLTALGSRDDLTFDRCIIRDDLGDTYKAIREHIYKGIEKSGGDPTQTFTCKDFIVFEHQEYDFMDSPSYEVYLKGYENNFMLNLVSKTSDIDKQEYYLRVFCDDATVYSDEAHDYVPRYEVAQAKVEKGEYTLIDLSKYDKQGG